VSSGRSHRHTKWRAGAALSILIGVVGSAHAEDPAVIRWEAPAGCPSEGEFRARVVDAGGTDGTVLATAAVAADGSWTVTIRGAETERVLTGQSCDEVASAAALVIAVSRPAPSLEEVAEPPAVRVVVQAPRPDPAARDEGPVGFAATQVGMQVGMLPGPRPVVAIGGGVRHGRVRVVVAAAFATAGLDETIEGDSMVDTRRRAWLGSAALCIGRRLALCAGGEGGRIQLAASVDGERTTGAGTWMAATAGPCLSLPLARRVELALDATILAALVRPEFAINGEPLASPPPLAIRASAGLRLQIP
jgi:hypothetical protein